MGICPVCNEDWPVSEGEMTTHVNSHFDNSMFSERNGNVDVFGDDRIERRPDHIPDWPDEKYVQQGSQYNGSNSLCDTNEPDTANCPICNFPFEHVSPVDRESHVNTCLDARDARDLDFEQNSSMIDLTMREDEDFVIIPSDQGKWDGPAAPGSWTGWVGKKPHKGDRWWDPVEGSTKASDIPSNFSPGLLPVLTDILKNSISRGTTRSAVLSQETVHISCVKLYDWGWGCGYRNALMAISALVASNPNYRPIFSASANGAEPGLRRLQGWMEESWKAGFDESGKAAYRGKVLGTIKWIGTGDLLAMFTYKGIPCQIYDFQRPRPGSTSVSAHIALQKWVKAYFLQSSRSSENAFDALMRRDEDGQGRGEAVRLSSKMPLILQHNGHSRTVVGYEENRQGDVNLLMYDPARPMRRSIREAGLSKIQSRPTPHSTPKSSPSLKHKPSFITQRQRKDSHESLAFSPPFTNGDSEIVHYPNAGPSRSYTIRKTTSSSSMGLRAQPVNEPVRVKGGAKRSTDDENLILVAEDEEMDSHGWVRKKISKIVHRNRNTGKTEWNSLESLNLFRVNLKTLGNHANYQVLAFTGGPVLSESARQLRKVVRGECIRYDETNPSV